MVKAKVVLIALMLVGWVAAEAAQEAGPAKRPNRLLTARLIAVTPMPGEFDRWITQDLKAWNRYSVSTDAEGADLVIRGDKPEKPIEFRQHEGLPAPKRERPGPAVLSITVIDWVANQPVWHATILDKKGTKEQEEPPPGSQVEIYARGIKSEELAAVIIREFRRYVEQLEETGGK